MFSAIIILALTTLRLLRRNIAYDHVVLRGLLALSISGGFVCLAILRARHFLGYPLTLPELPVSVVWLPPLLSVLPMLWLAGQRSFKESTSTRAERGKVAIQPFHPRRPKTQDVVWIPPPPLPLQPTATPIMDSEQAEPVAISPGSIGYQVQVIGVSPRALCVRQDGDYDDCWVPLSVLQSGTTVDYVGSRGIIVVPKWVRLEPVGGRGR